MSSAVNFLTYSN